MFETRININEKTKLGDLVIKYPDMLAALNLFSIPLGFRDKNIEQIARKYTIDLIAFETILRVYCGEKPSLVLAKDSLSQVLTFLRLSHKYFRTNLIPTLEKSIKLFSMQIPTVQGEILIKFFDGYICEINEHFRFEDNIVFPYIDTVLNGEVKNGFDIAVFEGNHTDIEQKLLDLRNILIKHIPENSISEDRRKILDQLLNLEISLDFHTYIEDHILIPSVRNLEVRQNIIL